MMKVINTVTGITSTATIEVPQSCRNSTIIKRREYYADQDGIAHALDGFRHDLRLIVEGCQFDSRRQRLLDARDFVVDQVGYLHRVAVRLTADVQQNRRFSVGGDNGIDRLNSGADCCQRRRCGQARPPEWF